MTRSMLPPVGHLPSYIRDAFLDAVGRDDRAELHRLAGLVWSCTDTLPAAVCDQLEIPSNSSYAQAARHIRATVQP